MEIFNECNAPKSFADAIYEAIDKSKRLLINEFGLTGIPAADVYIIDEKKSAKIIVPDDYKSMNFINRLEKIMARIKHIKYCYDIKQCYDLINELYAYINIMLDIASQTEIEITEKQRIKIKEHLIIQIRITLETHYGDNETDIKLNEILDDITEAERIYQILHISSQALGCFCFKENRIYICYKTINDFMKEIKLAGEYGSYILAHEFFHAFHYLHLTENIKSDSFSYPAYVRNCTVKESLAEYFAYTYAQKYAGPQILKKTEIYRIPAWGYTGSEIFKNYQSLIAGDNPLFNAVYSLSLFDMEYAYKLLCDYLK
ncbi:MAG: hypothetical protein ACYCWE_15460 [Eubacteriales bacterium]